MQWALPRYLHGMFTPRLAVVTLLLVSSMACTSESEPTLIEGACTAIVDACHPKDDGTGEVNMCHSVGHDEDAEECSAIHDMCIEICNAAPNVHDNDTDGHDTEHHEESESDEHGSTEPATTEPSTTEPPTTESSTSGEPTTESSSSTTGEEPTSSTTSTVEPNCSDLGSGCHDSMTKLGVMCHDIGHDGDETACAEAWDMCREECGF